VPSALYSLCPFALCPLCPLYPGAGGAGDRPTTVKNSEFFVVLRNEIILSILSINMKFSVSTKPNREETKIL
jgi:hypothetical protein